MNGIDHEHDASMPSATVQDDGWGEWQKHDGGECPIPFAEAGEYEIRYGDGTVYGRNGYLKAAAHGPVWTPSPKRELMITHYRLRKPAAPFPHPKDGSEFTVFEPQTYRWKKYNPDGQRQMKAEGRWQKIKTVGDFFSWENCDEPAKLATPPDLLRDALEVLKPFADKAREYDAASLHFGVVNADKKSPATEFKFGQLRAAAAILDRARKAGVL